MGVSLLYGGTGTLDLSAFSRALNSPNTMAQGAVVLIVVAFFLKAAIVPFHAWAPDAYEGASVPVTAYMSTVIKAGVLLAALRLFSTTPVGRPMADLLTLLPLISMIWERVLVDRARRLPVLRLSRRRRDALRSGGVLHPGVRADEPACLRLAAARRRRRHQRQAGQPQGAVPAAAVRGADARSGHAVAGRHSAAGFIAKFLIFKNVIAAGYTTYAVLGLLGSYLGIYFYLRVIQYAFMSADAVAEPSNQRVLALSASVLCLVPAILVAVFPGWFIGARHARHPKPGAARSSFLRPGCR